MPGRCEITIAAGRRCLPWNRYYIFLSGLVSIRLCGTLREGDSYVHR